MKKNYNSTTDKLRHAILNKNLSKEGVNTFKAPRFITISILILLTLLLNPMFVYAQTTSTAPNSSDIIITNNSGKADTICVFSLSFGDVVKVYNAAKDGKILGYATLASTTKDSVNINISQLGISAGNVYISITSRGELESKRTKISYSAEIKSESPLADNIIINNNVGKADTVFVAGLFGGETIKVYNAASNGKLIGSINTSSSKTEATVSITQLGIPAGSVYVSLTVKGELESNRTQVDYLSEPKTDPIDASNVSITNNAGVNDSITASLLSIADIVKVYNAPRGGNLLGSGTVSYSKTETTITIPQLGATAGSVYVTVTNKGKIESNRTQVDFPGELRSQAPISENITIVNNGGTSDTITVTGLCANDVVKVYDNNIGGSMLGTAAVASSKTEVTITVSQLSSSSGNIYISVSSKGKFESTRTEVSFSGESTTDSISSDDITVTNNSGKSDTVYVVNLTAGDIVKVYDSATGGKFLGSSTAASSKTDATITIAQLGTSDGDIYVSITSASKLESKRIKVSYAAETISDIIDANNITITNNPAGKSDIIYVTSLTAGDVIKAYDSATNGKFLGSATAASSKTDATISISQLGTSEGSVYISVISLNKIQSDRIKVDYSAEASSSSVDLQNIVVTNNVSPKADTVEVTNLTSGDIVKVYDKISGGKLLGSATLADYNTYTSVSITQLGTSAGSIYVSITSLNKIESSRIKVDYSAEGKTNSISSDNVSITNNAQTSDIVEVTGLLADDVIKVFDSAKGGSLLGTATVSAYSSYATVSISQLGTSAGSVYISVTNANKIESDRIKADYSAESKSGTISTDNIVVTNNAGTSDIIQATGLNTNDTVNVYDSVKGGTLLGSATVATGSTATINIAQLGTSAGSIYVSISSSKKIESDRIKVDYLDELKTDTPSVDAIEIANNVNSSDTIKITGLTSGDIVNAYDSAKAGILLGTATVDTYGSSVTITITQLGTEAGSIYVTVTTKNKLESDRTEAEYNAESSSIAPTTSNITIVNNAGTSDTVKVTGLLEKDVVNIYDAAKSGNLLGTATISTYGASAIITITQLGTEAGSIYVTVTNNSKMESNRVKADYASEIKSTAPLASSITIVNNAGISDTVKVTGLSGSDSVSIYDSETGGTLLGSATVNTYDSYAIVSITQLGSTAGYVYVSVTEKACQESDRTKIDYSDEPKSDTSSPSNIIVTNNAGISDTVQINGLSGGDVVNIYSSETGGTLLGTSTVSTYASYVTITITQLGTSAGSIYVSVINKGKLEGNRTKVSYAAEQKSDSPLASDIDIINYSGVSDIIDVAYLDEGDMIKVYDSETGGTLLGSATATDDTEVEIEISQLGTTAGTVYVSVTNPKKLESERTAVNYEKEATSNAPDTDNIKIENNYKIFDTITVSYLEADDVIKVYTSETSGTKLGYAIVSEDETEATIKVSQLGTTAGTVYITVTKYGEKESTRTKVSYSAEQQSTAPSSNNVVIRNNALGTYDTVTVSYLEAGDIIKVYTASTGGTQLGSATVEDDDTEATIKISQLGTSADTVYVSITTSGKKESSRTEVSYAQEITSDAPSAENVTIVNNSNKSDTVTVIGLEENDIVKVYNTATNGTLLGSGSVDEDSSEVTVKISQLSTSAGDAYISIISTGAYESERIKVSYSAEK